MRIAIYTRVSTEDQVNGVSLAAQKDRCIDFCKSRDWEVVNVFTDAGKSAGSLNRPALIELLDSAKNGEFDTILVYKIDRFSRNLKDLIITLDDLKKEGVNFTSVSEQIDTTTAMGTAFFQIIGTFAELERGMISERVNMSFDKKIKCGCLLNRPPIGYKTIGGKLMIDNKMAEKIKTAFELRSTGEKVIEISKELDIPRSSLYEVFKNPVYIGKVRYKNKVLPGIHEGIISVNLFNKVNR